MDDAQSAPGNQSAAADWPKAGSRWSRWLLVAVVVLVAAVVGLGAALGITTSSQADQINSLEQEVEILTARLDDLIGVAGAQTEQQSSRCLSNLWTGIGWRRRPIQDVVVVPRLLSRRQALNTGDIWEALLENGMFSSKVRSGVRLR